MKVSLCLFLLISCQLLYGVEIAPALESKIINHVDKLVDSGLKSKNLKPNPPIPDEVFLRRAYLDITGRIPTIDEYERFMGSPTTNRRNKLIDQLFDSKGYISNTFNYWSDMLRAKLGGRINTQNYLFWIKKSVAENKPYDQFVREMLMAEGGLHKTDNGAAGFIMRDKGMPLDNMSNIMQTFLATSMVCAQCHDHPYKKWSQMEFYKLAAFANGTAAIERPDSNFTQIAKNKGKGRAQKEAVRVVFQGLINSGTGKIKLPKDYSYDDGKPGEEIKAGVPYGPQVNLNYDSDNGAKKRKYYFKSFDKGGYPKNINGRKFFAEWVTSPENPMFTKTIVNRLFDRVFGIPLVGELTDLKESSMGTNPQLTTFLISAMKKMKYDTKAFMKVLYKTKAYQRQVTDQVEGKYYFQGPVMHRLQAEQLWDSMLSIRYKNPEAEFALPDYLTLNIFNEYASKLSFKDLLKYRNNYAVEQKKLLAKYKKYNVSSKVVIGKGGSNMRASEWAYPIKSGFLQDFGASSRELIDGDIKEATIPQALTLMNDSEFNLEKTALAQAIKAVSSKNEKIEVLYKGVLTRKPTAREMYIIREFQSKGTDINEIYWALINSHEFKLRK